MKHPPDLQGPGAHLVNLRYPARVEEHSLGQGGLPRVDVSGDPDVADQLVGDDPGGACPTAVDEHLEKQHTHRERQTDRQTETERERGSVPEPLHRSGLSSVQISSTFLTVTPLGAKRCVWAKHRPAFKTLIVTTARSDHGWSYSSSSTTPRSHSSYKPVNVTLKP